jgi:hypothetical protein
MNGYIVTKNGKYNDLNIVPGKTYECLNEIKDASMMYQVFTEPDVMFVPYTYKKDETKIFRVKVLGDVRKGYVATYTNKIKVKDEVLPSEYNKIFKDYIF